jgi:hypothetical protein
MRMMRWIESAEREHRSAHSAADHGASGAPGCQAHCTKAAAPCRGRPVTSSLVNNHTIYVAISQGIAPTPNLRFLFGFRYGML